MGEETGISWTNATWNPWHGCAKVSPGCKNCYMFREKKYYGQDPTKVVRSKTKFKDPLKWVATGKAPKYCFTCSWSDFFIEQADPWRADAWEIIRKTPEITYQILTKRPERIFDCLPKDWHLGYSNVWLGVSCENREAKRRLDALRDIPAALRFVSLEPLLEDLGLIDLSFIDWVIVGGESGPGARPMHPGWARSLRDQCQAANVPFFFKQNGEYVSVSEVEGAGPHHHFPDGATVRRIGTKNTGATLDGREWHEFPKVCVVQSSRTEDRS
jgi:protein gp37